MSIVSPTQAESEAESDLARLSGWLADPGAWLEDQECLIEFLALVGACADFEPIAAPVARFLAEHAGELAAQPAALRQYFESLARDANARFEADTRTALRRLQHLGSAHMGALAFGRRGYDGPFAELAAVLGDQVAAIRSEVEKDPERWLHAREFPAWVKSGSALGVFAGPPGSQPRQRLFDAFSWDTLCDEDRAALRRLVLAPGPWQAAYRAYLATVTSEVVVAPSPRELTLLTIPLPHLGLEQRLEFQTAPEGCVAVLLLPEGIEWGRTDGSAMEWGDQVTGRLTTQICRPALSDLDALRQLVDGVWHRVDSAPAARELALAATELAAALQADWLSELLQLAANDFAAGRESEPRVERAVRLAVDGRVALEEAAIGLWQSDEHAPVLAACLAMDERLRPSEAAVWVLAEDEYEALIERTAPDGAAWWGSRWATLRKIPDAALEPALEGLAAATRASRAPSLLERLTLVASDAVLEVAALVGGGVGRLQPTGVARLAFASSGDFSLEVVFDDDLSVKFYRDAADELVAALRFTREPARGVAFELLWLEPNGRSAGQVFVEESPGVWKTRPPLHALESVLTLRQGALTWPERARQSER